MEDFLSITHINYWNSCNHESDEQTLLTDEQFPQVNTQFVKIESQEEENQHFNNNTHVSTTQKNCTSFDPISEFEQIDKVVSSSAPTSSCYCYCNNHKNNYNKKDCIYHREKTELSDVLFSFKATPQMGLAVYPSQMSPVTYAAANSYAAQSQQLFSPNGYSPNYCLDQAFIQPSGSSSNGPNFSPPFPAMSVNVSMNMTMGYLPPPSHSEGHLPLQHHQTHWNHNNGQSANQSPPITSSYSSYGPPSQTQHSHLSSQPYNATYSFAADFRDPSQLEAVRSHWIPAAASTATHLIAANVGISSSSSKNYHSSSAMVSTSKHHLQKALRSSDDLSPSMNGFVSKTNLCRICGKTYARPSTLKTHLRTHSGEKPYRCIECYKSFSQAANLTAHVRTHSGEKPFHCAICDRKFSQSSSVTTHMRTHSGEKPYRCRLCKKAFSDSSTLTKHLRIHSGEKPYQCKLCLLRFSQSGNLNRHMRVHSSSNNNNNNNNNNHHHHNRHVIC